MFTGPLHGALTQIILSSVWSLQKEAVCWQEATCSETAGRADRMMAFLLHSIHSTVEATADISFIFSTN